MSAQTATDGASVELAIDRTSTPPVLDGRLDDAAWQRPPLALGEWLTYLYRF